MIKKILGIIITVCLIVPVFTACGQKTNNPSSSSSIASSSQAPTAAPEPFKISVSKWKTANVDQNYEDFKVIVEKAYKVKYPQATIVWDPIQGENYADMLKAQLATKTAPDVFFFQNAIVPFGNAGYLADLSSQAWAANILSSTKADVTFNGKLLAAPIDVAGWGVYYNKKVFTDLGVEEPKTFADFLAIAKKANDKGIVAFTGGYKEWQQGAPPYGLQSFLYGVNKNVAVDLFDGKTKMNGPEWNALFDALDRMVKAGVFPKNILSLTGDQAETAVGEGKAAMIFDGPWLCATVASKFPDTQLGFFVIPDDKGNKTLTSSVNQAVAVNAAMKDPQKGLDMVSIMVTQEAIAALLKNSSFSGLKGITVPQSTTGAKDYADELQKLDTNLQFSSWVPGSTGGLLTQITTKIIAGKGFDPKDLDAVDTAYQKDKGLINIVK